MPSMLRAFGGVRGSGCGAAPPFANVKVPVYQHGVMCYTESPARIRTVEGQTAKGVHTASSDSGAEVEES